MIRVEVVYAQPQRGVVKSFNLPPGALIADALHLAAADQDFSGIDWSEASVGIFGKAVQRDQPLNDGDRIEIYRPLAAEPKLARRQRARKTRQQMRQ